MIFLRVLYIFIFLLISSQSFSSSKCKYNFLPKSNEQPFALFTRSIDILNVPFRARNALKAKDIYYLGDLVTKTEIELMRIPHLKKTDINSINGFFLNMDLRLGLNINWPSDREQVEALVRRIKFKSEINSRIHSGSPTKKQLSNEHNF